MADDHAAVAAELRVGARIGGASTVVTLVSLAHAMSHAYGALLPLIVPFFLTDLHLTYTQVGLIFSISNLVWSPLQLGFGVLGRYGSRKLILGIGHLCQGAAIIGTSFVYGFADLLTWRMLSRIADAPQHPIGNALISQSFRTDRRGLALAINAAGSNLGTVAVPLIGGFLIATLGCAGWYRPGDDRRDAPMRPLACSAEARCDAITEQAHGARDLIVRHGGHGHPTDKIGNAEELAVALDFIDHLRRIADDETVFGESGVLGAGVREQPPASVAPIRLHEAGLRLLMRRTGLRSDVDHAHEGHGGGGCRAACRTPGVVVQTILGL